jgi:hypothetical protein
MKASIIRDHIADDDRLRPIVSRNEDIVALPLFLGARHGKAAVSAERAIEAAE